MYKTEEGVKIRREGEDKFLIYFNQDGFETNAVGARVLELCRKPQELKGLCEQVAREFDASLEVIKKDIPVVVIEFQKLGLVVEES